MCPFFNPYFDQKNYNSLLTVPLGPEAHLEFDGERLYWVDGENSVSWPAYSGARNLLIYKNFSVEAQKLKNMGPIPEGVYHLSRRNYQKYNKMDESLRSRLKIDSNWSGGTNAWGEHRIWLEKDDKTETWGRDGFSIHGGRVPGSAGCIDLTEHMPEFVEKFLRYGRPMRLEVRYKKK